jgi:Flp pilus assembly protein TadG
MPLLLILLGTAEFGRYFSQQLVMQHAAREAARVIALKYDDPGMDQPTLEAEAEAAISALLPPGLTVADLSPLMDLCVDEDAVVELEDTLTLAIPGPPSAPWNNLPVTATARMPCEG